MSFNVDELSWMSTLRSHCWRPVRDAAVLFKAEEKTSAENKSSHSLYKKEHGAGVSWPGRQTVVGFVQKDDPSKTPGTRDEEFKCFMN